MRDVHEMGLRGNLPIFLQNFLRKRFFQVRVGNVLSDNFTQDEGVPQGSVLSVILFIIKINGIIKQLPPYVHGSLFVDDFQIHCAGEDMNFITRQMQLAVNNINNWTKKNGFVISKEKTVGMHFCRRRGLHLDPKILLETRRIPMIGETKFLGLIFDTKLNFKSHIGKLKRKCLQSLNILKVLTHTTWGADRTAMLKIYKALVRSKLDYGCEIYGSTAKSYLKALDTVHHQGVRISLGAFRTSPIESLLSMANEPSLEQRRQALSLNYFFKIKSIENHPSLNSVLNPIYSTLFSHRRSFTPTFGFRIGAILDTYNIVDAPVLCRGDVPPPWSDTHLKFIHDFSHLHKPSTPHYVYTYNFNLHRQFYSDYNAVYTDGSKSDDYVGSAAVFNNLTIANRLHNFSSVFTSETHAICTALLRMFNLKDRKFIVYTDSRSCISALEKYSHDSHPLVLHAVDLWMRLKEKSYDVVFCWIPGHVGIRGNELADAAAKQAQVINDNFLCLSDAKNAVKLSRYKLLNDKWGNQTNNKLFEIKKTMKQFKNLPLNRHRDVTLTRLRIGHTRITHKHLLSADPAPICARCNIVLSVKHVLCVCPNFTHARRRHFGTGNLVLTNLIGDDPHLNLFLFLDDIGYSNLI